MKLFTLTATAALALGLATLASAQTELQTLPQPPPPGTPQAPAAPAPAAPAPVYQRDARALSKYATSSLELGLGWGAPYGWGVSYAHLVGPGTDLNVGVGLGVGAKIGVGVRHFFTPERNFSPYVGLNLARTGAIDNVTLTLDENTPSQETVIYSQKSSGLLHLRTGVRWQPYRVGLVGSLGYGVRLSGDPVYYAPSQYPSRRMQDVVQAISPGGLEISLGLVINLGQQ